MSKPISLWRVGSKVKFNVYSGDDSGEDNIVCMCRTQQQAKLIVESVNMALVARSAVDVYCVTCDMRSGDNPKPCKSEDGFHTWVLREEQP